MEDIIETLSPNERKIIPYLKESLENIEKKTNLDKTSIMRALSFLENKKLVKIKKQEKVIVDLGDNGVVYLKSGLPERRLLHILEQKNMTTIAEAKKQAKLSDNEIQAALGALRKKAMIELKGEKIFLTAKKDEVIKKTLEEKFLEQLPIEESKLEPEQLFSLKSLINRKDIIKKIKESKIEIEITELGKQLEKSDLSSNLIEELTPEILKNEEWKGKKFRRYDITSNVPRINGGKKHFISQGIERARKIWTELGFKEMSSTLTQTGFWNFDALFTAQDHPVREIQDTFYLDIKGKLPASNIVKAVKQAHEGKFSKGWNYTWNEEEAKRVLLRTHTTSISAKTLSELKEKKGKFFAVGRCFRNETVDWSHGFEFNQTEGIVVDKNANFQHLLGYLREFFRKMGFDEVKFVPSYFPYTEPSLEIYGYNKNKNVWIEIGGAGILRPEVVIPLLGEYIPVLAWGPGFDRTIMNYFKINDMRDMYGNSISKLREVKF